MIDAHQISYDYGTHHVLSGVDLRASDGEVVGLIGPNGSGKSTLLRTLHAALSPRTGQVCLDGTPVPSLPPRDVARRLSVVAQDAPTDIPMTVADMVLLGRAAHRGPLAPFTREDHRRAAASLRRVGVRDLAERRFCSLSGGERQRVLIARALAQGGDHLLLDEPTNHLDIRCQHDILRLVRGLGVTAVIVLHDLNLAARYCDRLVLLHAGSVVGAGRPEEVLTPRTVLEVYGMEAKLVHCPGYVQLLLSPVATGESPYEM